MKLRWKKNGPGYVAFTVHGMYVEHAGSVSYNPARSGPTFVAIRGGREGAQGHHEEQLSKRGK